MGVTISNMTKNADNSNGNLYPNRIFLPEEIAEE